jgi:hypothetical protein
LSKLWADILSLEREVFGMEQIQGRLGRKNGNRISRRLLLQTCGAFLALALLLPPMFGGKVMASVPTSGRFDLTAPSTELIREKDLHNNTVLQSFAFDNDNQHIYTVQLMSGGQQMPGESAPVSGSARALNGDLCVTKLDLSGNIISYMYLKGFGHGVQIGVEPGVGQKGQPVAYLWTEVDAVNDGTNGWGTQLARFPFTDGAVVTPNTPWLEKHQIVPGADRTTVNIDTVHGLLTMRYRLNGVFHFGVYDLAEVKQNRYVSLADVLQPALSYDFQGFTSFGSYLYLLEGTAYGTSGSVSPDGNTYITCVDLNTGSVTDRQLTKAGYTLDYREPEGMAIQIPDRNNPNAARLSFGFASGASGARKASIYYKDVLQ